MKKKKQLNGRPIIFGEVLFDHFPDGGAVLGGAPFNVAWHLQGFGQAPLLVSRIGDDTPGHQVKQAMQDWGLDTRAIQTDTQYPTGKVEITFEGAQHSFHILPDQAYDHIDAGLTRKALASIDPALFYHGTLIIRTETVRRVLDDLLVATHSPVFVDINLRDPWWHGNDLPFLLQRARWVKLNDEELNWVAKHLGLRTDNIETTAQSIHAHYQLQTLVVTLGAHGALAVDPSRELVRVEPGNNVEIIDTVGAGDAFASVVLLGLLEGWTIPLTLARAQDFATRICAQRGATTADANLYRQLLNKWTQENRSAPHRDRN
ncbi:MAG: PfkB family carbohydrate kinase [Gammaproteobacteria bacterium]